MNNPKDAASTEAPRGRFLSARKVGKVYNEGGKSLEVLKGVTLQVAEGDFLAIVGPSGAGKSTLLHILGLLDSPTQGEVWFKDDNLSRLSGPRQSRLRNRLFGFVFQFFHLLPDFTALENVLLPTMVDMPALAWPARRSALRQRAEQLLDMVGLTDRMRHRPTQLSGGEQQRVAICRALVAKPPVLLLDEPTGNLDTHTGEEIMGIVHKLNMADRQTVVMVTHDEEAAAAAGRIVHMRDGHIVSDGPPRARG